VTLNKPIGKAKKECSGFKGLAANDNTAVNSSTTKDTISITITEAHNHKVFILLLHDTLTTVQKVQPRIKYLTTKQAFVMVKI